MHKPSINRLPEVKHRTGLSRSTIYRQIKAGEFPAPVPLGQRAVGWLSSDVDQFIESRVASRKSA